MSADGVSCRRVTFAHLAGCFVVGGPHLGVSVRHRGHGHDVLQHAPGGEELLADEDSAARTQTPII